MDKLNYRKICLSLDFRRYGRKLAVQISINLFLAAIIITLLNTPGSLAYLTAQIIIPILFFRGFGLMHECVHQAAARNRTVNGAVGVITGILCFLPYESWKLLHLEHHAWAGNVDRDPALQLRRTFDPKRRVKNAIVSKIWRSWLPLLGLLQTIVFWKYPLQQLRNSRLSTATKYSVAASAVIPLASYFSLWFVWPNIFNFSNFGPGFALFLVLLENINAPHHLDVEVTSGDSKLPTPQQYRVTRTGAYPRWFSRFVLLNFNLHTEHHLFPSLPWDQLDKATGHLKTTLGNGYNETVGNAWIIEQRRRDLSGLLVIPAEQPTSSSRKVGG